MLIQRIISNNKSRGALIAPRRLSRFFNEFCLFLSEFIEIWAYVSYIFPLEIHIVFVGIVESFDVNPFFQFI